MLTITALTNAEYVISSVALSIDEYYSGVGESPGAWAGKWARALGLSGMVEADELRALVDGRHPTTGVDLVAGHRSRSVRAFDLTFSAPKSASILWALGSERVAEVVAGAHREAVEAALGFLEERAAVTRLQEGGVRRRVPSRGWAVAAFGHRTSPEGDPQLHSHCVVPNRAPSWCWTISPRPQPATPTWCWPRWRGAGTRCCGSWATLANPSR